MTDFSNKRILVTGGSRGIGKAIADEFTALGGEVIALSSTDCDFSSTDEINKFLNELPPIDVCINCAGINIINTCDEIDIEDFDKVFQINTRAPFLISQHVSKNMVEKKWGRIVNIASIWGLNTVPGRLSYTTSKTALKGMTKSLATELAKHNILVNSVSPGFTNTELTQKTLKGEERTKLLSSVPMGRMAEPNEIANAVVFLCSNKNSYITGQDLIIDGGFTI